MYTSITAIWLVASALWMGGAISLATLHPFLSLLECLAAAAPLGLTLSTWLGVLFKSYLFASSEGLTWGLGAVTCLVQTAVAAGLTAHVAGRWDARKARSATSISASLAFPLLLVALPLSAWFAFIHYTHSLLHIDGTYNVGGTVYGDMPFHLMIINSLLFGINKFAAPLAGRPLVAAFFTDARLVYPYIPDYHTALVAGAGSTLHFALFTAGTLLCTSFVVLMFFFGLRLTSSVVAATLCVPLALFCGGTGGLTWLLRDTTWAGLRSVDHILEDSVSRQITICWFSLPAHILLPQRTTQFAYPIALLAMLIILRACKEAAKALPASPSAHRSGPSRSSVVSTPWTALTPERRTRLFAVGGFVTGLLPLLQAHSFLAVGVVMLVVAGCQVLLWAMGRRDTRELRSLVVNWTVYGVCAFSIGLPQSLVYFGKVSNPGDAFIRLLPIWMDFAPEPNPIFLWLHAVGAFLPLHLLGLYLLPMTKAQRLFQAGFVGVFVVGNLVIFQPWVLDNTKVFYIWVFGAAGTVAMMLEYVWLRASASLSSRPLRSSNPLHGNNSQAGGVPPKVAALGWKALACLLALSLVLSGALCCFNETMSMSSLYDRSDLELAMWFDEHAAHDARVAISTAPGSSHMRPAAALAGRQIMASYWGWISNHGMPNYAQRNADANAILAGDGRGRELLLQHNVTHLVVDRYHLHDYDMHFINAMAYKAAQNRRFFVYQVAPYEALVNVVDCMPGGGVQEADCSAAGCIWVPNSSNDPYCQLPPVQWGRTYEPRDCAVPHASACAAAGCSWYEGFAGPYCHMALEPERPMPMPVLERNGQDCGWVGVTEDQCLARGCLWDPSSRGAWCQYVGELHVPQTPFTLIHGLA